MSNITSTFRGKATIDVPTTSIAEFNQITSVASGILTTLFTYTVPALKTLYISRVEVGGSNIAMFTLYDNGSPIDVKRTYFGGGLNAVFDLSVSSNSGVIFNAGDIITVSVIHNRPSTGDFEATLVGLLTG